MKLGSPITTITAHITGRKQPQSVSSAWDGREKGKLA